MSGNWSATSGYDLWGDVYKAVRAAYIFMDKVKPLAADENIGYREAVEILGISYMSIVRICQRNNIQWVKKSKVGEVHTKYTYRNRKPSQKK